MLGFVKTSDDQIGILESYSYNNIQVEDVAGKVETDLITPLTTTRHPLLPLLRSLRLASPVNLSSLQVEIIAIVYDTKLQFLVIGGDISQVWNVTTLIQQCMEQT